MFNSFLIPYHLSSTSRLWYHFFHRTQRVCWCHDIRHELLVSIEKQYWCFISSRNRKKVDWAIVKGESESFWWCFFSGRRCLSLLDVVIVTPPSFQCNLYAKIHVRISLWNMRQRDGTSWCSHPLWTFSRGPSLLLRNENKLTRFLLHAWMF